MCLAGKDSELKGVHDLTWVRRHHFARRSPSCQQRPWSVQLAAQSPDAGGVSSFVTAYDRAAYLRALATALELHLRRLSELPRPVVAGVHGAVAGAGLAFMLNADLVVAAASTRFAFAYPGIGLTPDCGVSRLLLRAAGQHRALEFALTGRVLTAVEARDWGLVAAVVDDDQVHSRTAELAETTARRAGPGPCRDQATDSLLRRHHA